MRIVVCFAAAAAVMSTYCCALPTSAPPTATATANRNLQLQPSASDWLASVPDWSIVQVSAWLKTEQLFSRPAQERSNSGLFFGTEPRHLGALLEIDGGQLLALDFQASRAIISDASTLALFMEKLAKLQLSRWQLPELDAWAHRTKPDHQSCRAAMAEANLTGEELVRGVGLKALEGTAAWAQLGSESQRGWKQALTALANGEGWSTMYAASNSASFSTVFICFLLCFCCFNRISAMGGSMECSCSCNTIFPCLLICLCLYWRTAILAYVWSSVGMSVEYNDPDAVAFAQWCAEIQCTTASNASTSNLDEPPEASGTSSFIWSWVVLPISWVVLPCVSFLCFTSTLCCCLCSAGGARTRQGKVLGALPFVAFVVYWYTGGGLGSLLGHLISLPAAAFGLFWLGGSWLLHGLVLPWQIGGCILTGCNQNFSNVLAMGPTSGIGWIIVSYSCVGFVWVGLWRMHKANAARRALSSMRNGRAWAGEAVVDAWTNRPQDLEEVQMLGCSCMLPSCLLCSCMLP